MAASLSNRQSNKKTWLIEVNRLNAGACLAWGDDSGGVAITAGPPLGIGALTEQIEKSAAKPLQSSASLVHLYYLISIYVLKPCPSVWYVLCL